MPQIIMLNHAAWVNSKRSGLGDDDGPRVATEQFTDDPVVWHGKRLSELSSDEMVKYYSDGV